ncbi:ATPase [Bacteroidia bacterium]|nr:ATPase [Bacteroidia bacterium]
MKHWIGRKDYIDKLLSYREKGMIKVVTGLRRSGKSTLLELFRNRLSQSGVLQEQIIFYDFELPESYLGKTWDSLYFEIKAKLPSEKISYIFLDEVQNIKDFEKLVDGLYATANTDVYITGSNANLLSGELATLLSGRYIEISILPFSFYEYLQAREIDTANKYLNYEMLFFDYVNETSMPKGVELRDGGFDKVYEYLEFLYATVVEKDIMKRHTIYDKRAFGNVTKFIAGNIGNQVSPSSISKSLKADNQDIHHTTVENYLAYLTESFMFYQVNRFDIKGKNQLATQEKYYIVDLGFLNVLTGREKTTDRGHILENIVYLELLRRGYKVWTGSLRNAEVDFVVKNKFGDIEYYQVSWNIDNEKTLEREFNPLETIKDNYPKFLLTTDSFPQNRKGITHMNVFEWLLHQQT